MATDLERLALRHGIRPGVAEAVGAAAARLGTTPRMLRYRESLGLVAPERTAGGYRVHEHDLLAASYAADLEERYGVPPTAVAFAVRAVHEAGVRDEITALGRLARHRPLPAGGRGTAQGRLRRQAHARAGRDPPGVRWEELTDRQLDYLSGWHAGT